eukprot:m.66758 g.66758  ORF g.66758 m.66758 type:complete len:374 (-) comp23721_c0_seq1:78-1199(-)
MELQQSQNLPSAVDTDAFSILTITEHADEKPQSQRNQEDRQALDPTICSSEPCNTTVSEGAHPASPTHALVTAMTNELLSNETQLCDLMAISTIHHVATYVVTSQGNVLLQRSRKNTHQSLGGCNYPNSLPRMMNSIRLELMDEGSVVLTNDNLIRISPLYALTTTYSRKPKVVLLQVALVKHESMSDLWSAEKARSRLGEYQVPPQAGIQASEKVKAAGRFVHHVPLTDCVEGTLKWRECDWDSFVALRNTGVFDRIQDMETPYTDGNKLVLLDPPPKGLNHHHNFMNLALVQKYFTPSEESKSTLKANLENMQSLFNHDTMRALREVSVTPWTPILWRDTQFLNSFELLKTFVNSQPDSHARVHPDNNDAK